MTTFPFSSTPARTARLIVVALALLLGLILLLAGPAQPAAASCGGVTTVSTEAELNAAIAAYNAVGTSPCVFTIQFSGDIPLTASTTTINNATASVELVIEGAGFAVDGQTILDVRPVTIAASTKVTINNLTVTGGNAADSGGIENRGNLTVTNSTISGNRAYNTDGGGILSTGSGATLTITNSTITNNTSDQYGGGVKNSGTGAAVISGSTIAGNVARNAGGGIFHDGSAMMTVRNSTISGNSTTSSSGFAGGGGIKSAYQITLDSVTITGNTSPVGAGALDVENSLAAATIRNSILANSGSADCRISNSAALTDGGHNLVEAAGSCSFSAGTSITGSDPVLGLLQSNGGPTQTHALLPGSPAINAGDTTLTTDQRGVTRPEGSADDIGAYEGVCEPFPLSAANAAELNAAINCYNAQTLPGTYTINITQDIALTASTPIITNNSAGLDLVIAGGGFTVDGQGTSGVKPFNVQGAQVTMNNLTVKGGNSTAGAGGIYNSSSLTLNNCTVTGNSAATFGGGIRSIGTLTLNNSTVSGNTAGTGGGISVEGGSASLDSVTVADNSATTGGGIAQAGGTVTLVNTVVGDNSASGSGPDLAGTITSADHNLVENTSGATFTSQANDITGQDPQLGALAANGGPTDTHALLPGSPAINAGDTTLTTDQRGVARPQGSADDIGAYEADACPAFPISVANESELNAAIACYNVETVAGAYTINVTQDIDLTASTTAIDNATAGVELVIEGSSHAVDGQNIPFVRAFTIEAATTVTIQNITITRCVIPSTSVTDTGGAVLNKGTVTVINSTLSANQGAIGAAINNFATGSTLTVINSTLSGNQATGLFGFGGAIYNGGGSSGMTMVINSTVSGNQASSTGGGIFNAADGQMTVINSTISDNEAPQGGGIVSSTDSTLTLHNTVVANSVNGDCLNGSATINAQNSLIEDGLTCVNGTNSNNLTGDPNLGVLQNNGGPTKTMALLPGSAAIDAGADAVCSAAPVSNLDQRSYVRPAGAHCDIGAYEANAVPLAVTLAGFDAAAQADHVLVTWETVSELENSGFNLYRTETADPPAAANLLAFVPSQGPGSAQGFAYSYPDYAVTAGQTYWYWLEDVDFSGYATMHGPVSVVFVAPTAVTLSGLEAAGRQQPLPVWPVALAAIAAALVVAGGLQLRRRGA